MKDSEKMTEVSAGDYEYFHSCNQLQLPGLQFLLLAGKECVLPTEKHMSEIFQKKKKSSELIFQEIFNFILKSKTKLNGKMN